MGRRKAVAKNRYGIEIVMECASCRFKTLTKSGRICSLDGSKVPSDFMCPSWELSPHLERAGEGGGFVKKREYLEYALQNLDEDIEKVRESYIAGHGGIYEGEE